MRRQPSCGHSWRCSVEFASKHPVVDIDAKRAQGYLIHQEDLPHGRFWVGVMPPVTKEDLAREEWVARLAEPVIPNPKVRELLCDESKWSPFYYALDRDGNVLSWSDLDGVYERGVKWSLDGAINRCYGDRCKLNRQCATVYWRIHAALGKRPIPEMAYAQVKAVVEELDL